MLSPFYSDSHTIWQKCPSNLYFLWYYTCEIYVPHSVKRSYLCFSFDRGCRSIYTQQYTLHFSPNPFYCILSRGKIEILIPDKEIAAFAFWPVSFFSPIDKVPSLLLASTRICLSSRIIRFCTHSTADAHKWGMTSENQTLHCRRQYSKRTLKLFQGVWRELFS